MSVKENAWNEIKSILTNDTTLATYNQAIYEGISEEQVPLLKFPCIILEPNNETENQNTVPYRTIMTFSVNLIGIMMIVDTTKQIVGESEDGSKGILDFTDDIKNALWQYPSLDRAGTRTCVKFGFPATNYIYDRLGGYPYRASLITMSIDLEFNKKER